MARPFGRDRRGSNSSSSSNFKLQSCGRTRSSKKRCKTKERLLLVLGLVVVVLIVLRKEVTKKRKRFFPNQKLEQGKNNQKGLGLDPRRNHQNNHQQLHFHHHQHNQNQTQNQILISGQVVEVEEKEQEQEKEASDKEEQSSFHGFHNQYFQQAQEFHQQHQFLYGGGRLESQSSPSQQPPPQPPKKRSYLPSSSSQTKEYASGLRGKMGDTTTTSQNHQTTTTSSRLGRLRNTGVVGEIVEVQGGHIVRSTGRKDRHSKVCTAKGPRDRRVRLSAHTAIQFYDVQDRLGYDRPSKAVDWLIKKAKAAIDELEELPAWTPTANSIPINLPNSEQEDQNHNQHHHQQLQHQQHLHHSIGLGSTSNARRLNDQQQQPTENNSSFLPPSMDSDSIADTIKSFFPMGASTETTSSAAANIQFHHNFPPPDLLSRTSSHSQDLRLSLQSFQDPMLLHHHNHQNQQQNEQAAGLFSGNPQIGFDGSGWSDNPPGEMGRLQRLVSWNAGGDTCHSGSGGGAFVFNSPPAQPMLQPLFGQSHQLFSQRGTLQSSNTPSFRAWIDQSAFSAASDHHQNQASLPFHPSSISGIGFASGGGFSSFRIPARIQGEEEEHDGISDKPSSASSDSRH